MANLTVRKGRCSVCGRPYRLREDGTVRSHWARNPDGTAAVGLHDCDGTGKPPAGTEEDDVLDRLAVEPDASIAALGEVLDVEAGLADILNRGTETKEASNGA